MDAALFTLKKFLGGLLMPVPLSLLLLFWTVLFLLRKKTRWLGSLLALAATVLLFVASYPPLSTQLTGPLEQQYPSYYPGTVPAEVIAVLGSAQVSSDKLPLTSEIAPDGIVRLAEGIRIYRLNPGSKLVFTGYHAEQPDSYAEQIRQLAIELGVPESDAIALTGPRDTAEEAALIAKNFPDKRLVLVTSAMHMPRAMSLFQQAGLQPTPAPTHHQSKPVRSYLLFPNAKTLAKTEYWAHERLGLLWARLTRHLPQQATGQ